MPSVTVRRILIVVALASCACTSSARHAASPTPSSAPQSVAPTAAPATYGGNEVAWPHVSSSVPTPPALGAIVTTGNVTIEPGRAIPSGLTLPRVGGTETSPVVLTPCDHQVRLLRGRFDAIAPAGPGRRIVVVDPGHGGHETGAAAPDGTPEAARVLQIAEHVRDDLAGRVDRVVLTRTADRDTSLAFRVALADALRASFAVSVHLNADPDGPSDHPGTSTFASLADASGRRAAGVLFQAERRYLDSLTLAQHEKWASNRDAGALYRIGEHGDYYYLLRRSHVTWVISESLYITNAPEAALVARDDIRRGLAHSIADGVVEFLTSNDPGSGWRVPLPRPPAPPAPPTPCVDPSA